MPSAGTYGRCGCLPPRFACHLIGGGRRHDALRMGLVTADAISRRSTAEPPTCRGDVANLPVVDDCESVIANVPGEMLDFDGCRSAISAEMWDQHAK